MDAVGRRYNLAEGAVTQEDSASTEVSKYIHPCQDQHLQHRPAEKFWGSPPRRASNEAHITNRQKHWLGLSKPTERE